MIWSDPILGAEWRDQLTGEITHGRVVNTHFCPVTTEWYLLIAEDDGRFHNIRASDLTVQVAWHYDGFGALEDEDDDELGGSEE